MPSKHKTAQLVSLIAVDSEASGRPPLCTPQLRGGGVFFPRVRGFLENVRQFIPRLRFFFFLFLSGD